MTDTKNQKLFNDFPPISGKEWKDKITIDLKGADFNKKLVWKTLEGFSVNPHYRQEDLENLSYLENTPGKFPFVRGNKESGNDWYIRQDIQVSNIKDANKKALDILMKGVTSLGFIIDPEKEFTEEDLEKLLAGISLDCIELNIDAGHQSKNILSFLKNKLEKDNLVPEKIHGSILYDPLNTLNITGNFCRPLEYTIEKAKETINEAKDLPNFKVIGINGSIFNNSGSSIIQELAFSLAEGTEYLSNLISTGLSINEIVPKIKFSMAVGSNYFMEIAKFRAGRLLWSKIVEAFDSESQDISQMHIHAVTSQWNKTIYDPYVNMLRSQTEAMSAALGGIDSLTIDPFNKAFEDGSVFSERIARNQQILLKEEAYFDKVADPSAGSYYIEQLTDSIAEHAWNLFLEVQDIGGYIEAFKVGFIQNKINEISQKRDMHIAIRKENFLGTNQFPNFSEKINKPESENTKSEKANDAIVEPLRMYRGAQAFEKLRLITDRNKKQPKAYMFTYGNLAMRKARAQFSCNFFACAGFEVIDNNGFATIEEGVKASIDHKADIVVICSSDDEYTSIVPEIYEKLKDKAIVVVAGVPKCMDDLKAKGINNFIHIKTNVLESLKFYQKELGLIGV